MLPNTYNPNAPATSRKFYPGLPHHKYRFALPNRVWKLFHEWPKRYQRRYSLATDDTGAPVDYLDHRAYAFCVRSAIFVIYSEWPDKGQTVYNLLQDMVGEDLNVWEQQTLLQDIVFLLYKLDV